MVRTVETLKVGESASFAKTVTETDVVMLAGISGDFNPAHVDAVSAEDSIFGQRIAHGMLSASFISAVLGTKLPGPGAIYISQDLKFKKPVYIGDTITATATVTEVDVERNRVTLETTATNQEGEAVIVGTAKLMPPKAKKTS